MIVSRTPLRVSLAGGGSDLPSFYRREEGAVVSFTINKCVYLACHNLYAEGIRLSYSRTENVRRVSEIVHPLIRETLKALDFESNVEIGSFADVPASGTGLGSSSAFTVGLVNTISTFMGKNCDPAYLARMACEIEIARCQEPIGKQDQYAAAFGGISSFRFHENEDVTVTSLSDDSTSKFLESALMLFDLGFGRKASEILARQSVAMSQESSFGRVRALRDLVKPMCDAISSKDYKVMADVLAESWELKREVATGITNTEIQEIHDRALASGALAGKVVGAGGGGFLLLVVNPEDRARFKKNFDPLRELEFQVSQAGSTIVFNDENQPR
jgi:D-glycero-alpha-D-manno-heptose-7-phosphate kinase